jgi:hypothetical protein
MATNVKRPRRITLTGLPGMPREVRAVLAQTRTEALHWLRKGETISAAGEQGSIDVWYVDGWYQCEFARFKCPLDQSKFTTLAAVAMWLRRWWAKLARR